MDSAVIMNLVFGLLEPIVLTGCLFYFFEKISRKSCEKTIYYRSALIGSVLGFYAVAYLGGGNNIYLFFYQLVGDCLIGYFLYEKNRLQLFYTVCYVISIFIMQGFIVYLLITWLQTGGNQLDYIAINLAILVKAVLAVLITKLWTLFLNRSQIGVLPKQVYLSLFIPLGISSLLFYAVTYMANVFIQLYGAGLVALIILMILLLNVYFVYLLSYLAKISRLQNEFTLLNTQNELQLQYYDRLERKYQDSRKLVHDMRNHLFALKQLYQEGNFSAAEVYDGELQLKLDTLGQPKYCENRILDIILAEKMQEAKERGIKVDMRLKELALTGVKNTDITAIFANLLDNALEACGDHQEGAYIYIKAGRFRDFLVVDIENSVFASSVFRKNGSHKGLGLFNVKHALEAYHGSLITCQEGGSFHASINIPLETK